MDLTWFEMREVRRRRFDNAVWIPLRAIQPFEKRRKYGELGYREEFFGAASIAVPLAERVGAEKLSWSDVGISRDQAPYVEDGRYIPSDTYLAYHGETTGIWLVLEQRSNGLERREWHLHQDLVIGLGLLREGDKWLAMHEGYTEAARLTRDERESPTLFEVRSEYLKDYLRARGMALYLNSYRNRVEVFDTDEDIAWRDNPPTESQRLDRWEGRAYDIHEGGQPFGSTMAVFHASRTDIDPAEDVPTVGSVSDGTFDSSSWRIEHEGKRLTTIQGELWRSEWVEPGTVSPRVRGDRVPSTISFLTDAAGSRAAADSLRAEGRWLWFRPDVMMVLAHRRGGSLNWYSRDTGDVRCSPEYRLHFGMNDLGLITVYAKDVALLPEWQQHLWAGFNITPEGGVSKELLDSQVRAEPARTKAPEALIPEALEFLTEISLAKFGASFILQHKHVPEILRTVHRFRAVNREGLFALAKDVARVIVDNIDTPVLQKIVKPPKETKWGSLKSLENVVALKVGPEKARTILGPLAGIYELRNADAHLPGSEIDAHLELAGVDQNAPFVIQGLQLLTGCEASLATIAVALNELKPEEITKT
jgi:hypothetical protein